MLKTMEVKQTDKNHENKENLLITNNKSLRSGAVRSLSFTPLRLNLLQKDILEAANEPLSTVEDVLESDDDKDEEENIFPLDLKSKAGNNSIDNRDDCFINHQDIELSGVNINNEIRELFEGKVKKLFIDKRDDQPWKFSRTNEIQTNYNQMVERKSPEHRSVLTSGKGNIQTMPRIQCSIEMNSVLETPSNNLKPLKNSSFTRELKTPIEFNGAISDHCIGETLKIDKVFGSIKKQNEQQKLKQLKNITYKGELEHSMNSILNSFLFNTVNVNNKTYIILKELGRGGSSVVYFCFDPITKEERALKKVCLSKAKSAAVEYINEVEILKKLQKCNRIIRIYDSEVQEHPAEGKLLWVVLEKGGIDLGKILKKVSGQGKHLANHVIMFYWMEMLYAVKQIHENGIIHSDLKPANFIKAETSLKLIDFGIASCIQSDMTSVIKNVAIGSFDYISPEALFNENSRTATDISSPHVKPKFKISFKSDVWSLGCILYQLVFGKTPFQHIGNTYAKLSTIMDPEHEVIFPAVEKMSRKLISTIKQCLNYNVKERPSVDELIENFEC